MLRLLNSQRQVMPPITKYKDLKIERVLDYDDRTLSFSIPVNAMPVDMMLENYIQTQEDEYVIKQITLNGNYYDITAQLNIDELEGTHWEIFATTEQTVQQTANLALAGTGWTCVCDISKKRSIKKTNVYTWDILKQIVKTYRLEMIIDSLNKNIKFVEKRGEDKGVYFSSQLNLRSVGKQAQTADFYTRIIPVGKDGLTIEAINGGKKYLENHTYSSKNKTYYWKDERYTNASNLKEDAEAKLTDMATPRISYSCDIIDLAKANNYSFLSYGLGDVVTIIDSVTNIRVTQRIVKMIEYPESPEQNQCEISNTKLSFEELSEKYEDTADTVDNITTDNGTIDSNAIDTIPASKVVIANNAEFKNVETEILNVTDMLTAANAKIGTLETTKLTATTAELTYAKINTLEAVTGRIEILEANALTANSAEIKSLKAGVADINTLMFGTAAGGSLTTEFSNSVVGLIGDAQIKSAMIKDISADKIISGKLYTNLVKIVSQSGNLDIADNTIQIRDSNKTARVQIGKDASGDYNIYIWDKNGSLMFDPLYGVQADGIKRPIIRNDMISDTANISGKKIDIASLITSINADGSSTLNASKIYVDTDKQTLDVSFKNLTTSVSTVSTSVTTAVNTANTANATANSAKSTATTANTTANTAKTTADTAKQTATTASNTANTANGNANSALSKANTLEANLKTVTEKVTTQGTQLTAIQGNISSKIWQQDITTAVTSLEIGGRNLLPNSTMLTGAGWGGNTSIVTGETDHLGGKKAVKIKGTSTTDSYRLIDNVLKGNGYYTISFWAKADKAFNLKIHEGGNVAFGTAALTTSWKYYTYTLNVKDVNTSNRFYFGGASSWKDTSVYVYIAFPKLEKGVKATDWTPAPEDIDSSLTSLESSTKTLSTQYTSLNQTLTSLSATVNSNTTKINTKADGSTVTSLQSKVTSIQTDLSGYKTTVTNTYATKSSLSNYATTTAMNSAINQKANSITQTVSATYSTKAELNNLQIGGVNLYKGTKDFNTTGITWKNISVWQTDGTYNNFVVKKKSSAWNVLCQELAVKAGEIYTFSCYIKNSIAYNFQCAPDLGNTGLKWEGISEKIDGSKVNTWQRISKTIKILADGNMRFSVEPNAKGGTVWICGLKLEKGNRATDWTPAIEDMATKAMLELKIDKTDNGKIVSMINAAADEISLKSNRLSWSSTGTSMTKEGNFTCTTGKIGGFNITSTGINSSTNLVGMNITNGWAFYAGKIVTGTDRHIFCIGHEGNVYSNGSCFFNGSANFNGVTNANGEFYVTTSRYGQCAVALTAPGQSIKMAYDAAHKNLIFFMNGTQIANVYGA